MIILGVSGSIAMGKSTAARALSRLGVRGHNADAMVHKLLTADEPTIAKVAQAFPTVVSNGGVDRRRLARQVSLDAAALRTLEAILHPTVWSSVRGFLMHHARHRHEIVALEIPLLFETDADQLCDAVVILSAPSFVQQDRLLRRPGFDRKLLRMMLDNQLADAVKRSRADFVVPTGLGHRNTLRALLAITRLMRRRRRARLAVAARPLH